MNLKEYNKLASEAMCEGASDTVIHKRLTVAGMDKDKASLLVRVCRHRHIEKERLEKATDKAFEHLRKGTSEDTVILGLMAVEGMYVATKAVHRARISLKFFTV